MMKFINNELYQGEWKGGEKHGRGIYRFENGDVYDGTWENGKRSGIGEVIDNILLFAMFL